MATEREPESEFESESGSDPISQTNPGDEAAPGTPGTGDDVCPVCHGSGKLEIDGGPQACANCGGTGVITEGIGGG